MKRFCPKCGKEVTEDEIINNFCIDCYLKDNDIIIVPDIEITMCVKCGKIKYTHRWFNNFDEIEAVIKKSIKVKDLKQPKTEVKLNLDFKNRKYSADITVVALIGNKLKTLTKEVPVVIKKDTCIVCSRIAGSYYTTIIQLRYDTKQLNELLLEKHITEIEKISEQLNTRSTKPSANLHIVKEFKQKTGHDLYLDNIKLTYNIVQHLMKQKYAVRYNTSKTLVGVDKDGQRVYRTTFCVHFGEKK